MNYLGIKNFDVANARGLSVVLFVSGCEHHCVGCHNPQSWDFCAGQEFTFETLSELTSYLQNPHISNLVISGGDPLHPKNIKWILNIAEAARLIREDNSLNIIIYTGYKCEDLLKVPEFLELTLYEIVLIDGQFEKNNPTKVLDYRGSLNQKAYYCLNHNVTDISDKYFREKTI